MPYTTSEFAFILNGHGLGEKIDLEKVKFFKNKKLWIHVDYKDEEVQNWLLKSKLDETVVENLIDEDTSPRYFSHDNGLLIVMRGVNFNKKQDEDDMIALHMWIEKNRILTLSHRPLCAVKKVYQNLKKGIGPNTPIDCAIDLMEQMTNEINESISIIADEVDEIEEDVIDLDGHKNKEIRNKIAQLRHKIVGFRRYIAPQRDVAAGLKNITHPLIGEDEQIRFRDITLDLKKAVEDLDFARDHSNVTQEELDSKTNISISQTMYLMSIIMVIFTPMTFLTGLLGANIGGIPFAHENGFLYVSVAMFFMIIGQLYILKKIKWF